MTQERRASAMCRQCGLRWRQFGQYCRVCMRIGWYKPMSNELAHARDLRGTALPSSSMPPPPPRHVHVDGLDWWSIWDGKESIDDAVRRHRRGVVLDNG